MRRSRQLLLGQLLDEAGHPPVILFALRHQLAEAHGRPLWGKERISGVEGEQRNIAVNEGLEERQVPLTLGTAQVGKNLLGGPPAVWSARRQALVHVPAGLFQLCYFPADFLR